MSLGVIYPHQCVHTVSKIQIDALSEIVDTVQGRIEVYLDGGIRTGSDVLKSLALGAKCVFIGRPAVWGLAYKVLTAALTSVRYNNTMVFFHHLSLS